MAREEGNGQGHTIVGGRPAGQADLGKGIPRGMELVLKKAAVDAGFCERLLAERLEAVKDLGLTLDSSEEQMLQTIPVGQLRLIISRTKVPAPQKSVFLGTSVAAMVALITQFTFSPVAGRAEDADSGTSRQTTQRPPNLEWEGGARPDLPPSIKTKGGSRPEVGDFQDVQTKGIRPDFPMPPGGARPDVPIQPIPPSPSPLPVEESGQGKFPNRIVTSPVAGRLFLEAVKVLSDEVEIRIEVEAPGGFDIAWEVQSDVSGKTLHEALTTLCLEKTGSESRFQLFLSPDGSEIVIRFLEPASATEIQPEPSDHHTRGSRPDFPGRRQGD
jgi:hypothetical protein